MHHGRVVKRIGDGLLVEFRSVVDAVRCAIEVQNNMLERNSGLPPERRIEFRIGINLGDVVEEFDGDLMGNGVNIAARLEGIAKPGTICLSEDAYRQVKARLDFAVNDLGATLLKNIAEPVRVYALEVGKQVEANPGATTSEGAAFGSSADHNPGAQQPSSFRRLALPVMLCLLIATGAGVTIEYLKVPGTRSENAIPSRTLGTPARQLGSQTPSRPIGSLPSRKPQIAEPPVQQDAVAPPAEPPAAPVPPKPAQASPNSIGSVTPVQVLTPKINEANVLAFAAKRNIPLPASIKLHLSAFDMPKELVEYIGVFGGDNHWNGGGRLAMLIVTSVDKSGAAFGFFAFGPPNPHTYNQAPAGYVAYQGKITENGLAFSVFKPAWRYQFKLKPGGVMVGSTEGPNKSHGDIVIERLN